MRELFGSGELPMPTTPGKHASNGVVDKYVSYIPGPVCRAFSCMLAAHMHRQTKGWLRNLIFVQVASYAYSYRLPFMCHNNCLSLCAHLSICLFVHQFFGNSTSIFMYVWTLGMILPSNMQIHACKHYMSLIVHAWKLYVQAFSQKSALMWLLNHICNHCPERPLDWPQPILMVEHDSTYVQEVFGMLARMLSLM